jgi:hypothetical protein
MGQHDESNQLLDVSRSTLCDQMMACAGVLAQLNDWMCARAGAPAGTIFAHGKGAHCPPGRTHAMRSLVTGFLTLGIVALVGCNTSPPGASGSGVARNATFDIKAPSLATTLKQGDTKEVKLTIDRGKDFHGDVTIKFDPASGITVDPSSHTVTSTDDKDLTVKISAAKDAAVGEHDVKVVGTPAAGNSTSVTFKVKVEKIDAK